MKDWLNVVKKKAFHTSTLNYDKQFPLKVNMCLNFWCFSQSVQKSKDNTIKRWQVLHDLIFLWCSCFKGKWVNLQFILNVIYTIPWQRRRYKLMVSHLLKSRCTFCSTVNSQSISSTSIILCLNHNHEYFLQTIVHPDIKVHQNSTEHAITAFSFSCKGWTDRQTDRVIPAYPL